MSGTGRDCASSTSGPPLAVTTTARISSTAMAPNVLSGRARRARYREHVHPLASIPSPTQSVWHLGPLPVRAYALCIVAGIFVAIALTLRRWRERGGRDEDVWDVAGWAIVFGIVGGRLYHVITDPELSF